MDNENYCVETEPVHYVEAMTKGGRSMSGFTMPLESSGYTIACFDSTPMLEIQRIDELGIFESDEEAVEQAVKDGIKLIPVKELPENFERHYLGWIDTPENRREIEKYCRRKRAAHTLSEVYHDFDVETPMGTIRIAESRDEDYPGVALLFIDKDGKEHSSCLMEYSEPDDSIMLRVWSPKDPDGDPAFILDMNK